MVTLAIVLAIASLTIVYAREMQNGMIASRNTESQEQAREIVDGVSRAIVADLWQNIREDGLPQVELIDVDGGRVGDGLYWVLRPNFDDTTLPTFGVFGESGRLDVNVATSAQLQSFSGVTADVADAIVDWRDRNEDVRNNGAEAAAYASLDPPYLTKNARMETVEELRLVFGMDNLILFGEDGNRNGLLDESENDNATSGVEDNGDGTLDRGLYDFVTVYTPESAAAPDEDDEPINLANARESDIVEALGAAKFLEARARDLADKIVEARPLNSLLECYVRLQISSDEQLQIGDRFVVDQPLPPSEGGSPGSGDEGEAEDPVTTKVDFFYAPAQVLETLPGMEPGDGDTIVAARSGGDAIPGTFTWIATTLGNEKAFAVGRYVARRSTAFSADIIAVSGDGRAFARRRVIIDVSEADASTPPRIIYSRDLSPLGWPLNPEILADLRSGLSADEVSRRYATGVNP